MTPVREPKPRRNSPRYKNRAAAGVRQPCREEPAGPHPPTPDFIDKFVFPLPVTVIGELLDIAVDDRAQFQEMIRDLTLVMDGITADALATAGRTAGTIIEFSRKLIERRRRES